MRELRATLDELDELIRTTYPSRYGRFRPGISERELDELADGLRPYHLPSDLVELYRWHDGWDAYRDGEYCALLADAQFNSLAEAIAQYRVWWETLGADGWHPLWFPCFGEQSGELVVLQLEPGRPAGGLLSFHAELNLASSYDSVAALFAMTTECWRNGLMPPADPSYFPPEITQVAARHNPRSRTPEGLPRREISRWATTDWPQRWKDVLGIGRLVPAADELVVTIAEFVRDPLSGRPIRGEIAGWGGSFHTFIATATDATGSVHVLLSRDATENIREFVGGRRLELWLAPIGGGELDEVADQMRGLAEIPAVSYFATRIVPL